MDTDKLIRKTIERYQDDFWERLLHLADLVGKLFPGDFVNVGAGTGGSAVKMCAAALKWNRKVVAWDDWGHGTREDWPIFENAILPYRDLVEIVDDPFHAPPVMLAMRARPICLALIHGPNEYQDVLANVLSVGSAAVVVVGDKTTRLAVEMCAGLLRRELYQADDTGEYYIYGGPR